MLVAWQHQVIAWTNIDLSSVSSSDGDFTKATLGISQEIIAYLTSKFI